MCIPKRLERHVRLWLGLVVAVATTACSTTPSYMPEANPSQESDIVQILEERDAQGLRVVFSNLPASALLVTPAFTNCNAVENLSFNVVVQNLGSSSMEVSLSDFTIRQGFISFETLSQEGIEAYMTRKAKAEKRGAFWGGLLAVAGEMALANETGVYQGTALMAAMDAPTKIENDKQARINQYRGHVLTDKTLGPMEDHGGLIVAGKNSLGNPYSFDEKFAEISIELSFSKNGETHTAAFQCVAQGS